MPDSRRRRPALRYREQPPPPALGGLVECLWMAWDPRARPGRPVDHIVPDGCPELILHLGDPFRRHIGGRWRTQPRAFLAGTLSRPWRVRAGRRVRTLGVRFRPGTVTSVFAIAMRRAADREVPLARLAGGAETRALLAGLDARSGAAAAFRRVEPWLLGRAAAATRGPSPVTAPAVAAILAARGRRRIAAVAAGLGVHPRRLERAFARDLGIRPKLFARIVRLNAALASLDDDQRAPAVDWALDAGFFDQAHLSRDFRAVAGRRPRAPREADGELARHFTAPRRLLQLLGGE